jgi:5-methylcytosine-specific restriction endonuclease McrA
VSWDSWKGRKVQAARARILASRPPCWICLAPNANELDHVIPRWMGGSNDDSNLRPAHSSCNRERYWAERRAFLNRAR